MRMSQRAFRHMSSQAPMQTRRGDALSNAEKSCHKLRPPMSKSPRFRDFPSTGSMQEFTIIIILSMMVSFGMVLTSMVGGPPFRCKHVLQYVMFVNRVRVRAYDIPVIHVMYNVAGLTFAFAVLLCKNFQVYTALIRRLYQVQVTIATIMHVYYVTTFVVFYMSRYNALSYLVSWLALVWQDTWCDDLVEGMIRLHGSK